MRRHRAAIADDDRIDMTPMLDVVFILLIFFIVSSAFIDEVAIDFEHSQAQPAPAQTQAKDIVFRVAADNDIELEGRRVDVRSVRAHVERLRALKPEARVVIDADPEASIETYIRIADQARLAGVEAVALLSS